MSDYEKKLLSVLERIEKRLDNAEAPLKRCQYTIGEWADIWLETYKKDILRPLTYQKYEGINRNYIKPLFGYMPLSSVDSVSMQKIFKQIPFPRERQHILAQLKSMFNKAVNLRFIDFNPINNVELPIYNKPEPIALTREEEKLFIAACQKDKYCDFWLVCLYAGLRRGEALALTRRDIDFENRIISVSKSFNQGKSHETKTASGVRKVPLTDALFVYLQKYSSYESEQRLFPINEGTVSKHFTNIFVASGIERHITTHSLRHTFSTRCYELGIDEKTSSKWCGHKDPSITLQIYTHCNSDHEKEQIAILNKGVK